MNKKTQIKFLFISIMFILLSIFISYSFSGVGSGTSGNPYNITNCSALQEMSDELSAHYQVVNNVDCDVTPFNVSPGFDPVGNNTIQFTGSFEGNNFNITNLYINRSTNYVGLFGYTQASNMSNVNLVDVNITSTGDSVGGLAGYLYSSSSIDNSYATGSVTGDDWVVGLVSR